MALGGSNSTVMTARNPRENPNSEALLQKMASKLQAVRNATASTLRHSGKQRVTSTIASTGGHRHQNIVELERENSTKKLKIRIQELMTSQSSQGARNDIVRNTPNDITPTGIPSPKGHRPETVMDSATTQYFLNTVQGLSLSASKKATSLTRKPLLSPQKEEM